MLNHPDTKSYVRLCLSPFLGDIYDTRFLIATPYLQTVNVGRVGK
jgi:hypothetical protein